MVDIAIARYNSDRLQNFKWNSDQIKSFSEFPLTDSIRLTSLQIADSLSYPTRIYDYDSLFAFKDLSRENQVILFSKKTRATANHRRKRPGTL